MCLVTFKDKLLDIIIEKRSSLLRDIGIQSIFDNKQNNVSMDDICASCNFLDEVESKCLKNRLNQSPLFGSVQNRQ